jgi:hypothetical protein
MGHRSRRQDSWASLLCLCLVERSERFLRFDRSPSLLLLERESVRKLGGARFSFSNGDMRGKKQTERSGARSGPWENPRRVNLHRLGA